MSSLIQTANADSNCPCDGCQSNGICKANSDDMVMNEAWYDPTNARIFDTSKQSYLPPHANLYLPKAIQDKRVVCVGEVHSNPCHHKLEFDVVKSLSLLVPPGDLAVGLECFYRQHQFALDRYVYGHQDFGILKKETNWDSTWGFDINHYAKIFHYAALNRIRLVGLNVPMGVTKLVVKNGLDGLPPSLKQLLPEVDLGDARHRLQFLSAMRANGHDADPTTMARMYEAQTLWDEYMAESASNYMLHASTRSPTAMLCVIAGVGHVLGRAGIPDRIQRRTSRSAFVIVPQQVAWARETGLPEVSAPPSVADCDWAWFTQRELYYS